MPVPGEWPGPPGPTPAGTHLGIRPGLRLEAWQSNIESLVDVIAPDHNPSEFDYWTTFVANCVLYDPPDDKLCEFAEAAGKLPQPISLSRADLPDPHFVEALEKQFWAEVLREMDRRLAPTGIDLFGLFSNILENPTPAMQNIAQQKLSIPTAPHIKLTPDTTAEQVKVTFKAIADEMEARPKAGRPPRDRLVAVQCHILSEKYSWSDIQLATKFGWTVSEKDGRNNRWQDWCDTAVKYKRDGKAIIESVSENKK
jgi:hypothetical protein